MPRKQSNPTREVPWGFGYVQQRGSRWQARWPETRDDGSLVWRAKSFATSDQAYDHVRQLGRKRRDGAFIEPHDLTVSNLIDDWLRRGKRRWKSNTFGNYRNLASTHILPELGRLRVHEVSASRVQHWIDQLADRELAPGTVRLVCVILRNAFEEALRLEIVTHSPVRGVILPDLPRREPPTWSIEEVRAVLAYLQNDPLWHALYLFALTTGCRPGEVLSVQWSDLSASWDAVTIRRTLTRTESKRYIIGTSTKTSQVRTLAVSPATADALERWKADQDRKRADAAGWEELNLVFTNDRGRFLLPNQWMFKQRAIAADAGVSAITLHGLRHTSATLDMAAGVHVKLVQDRLGHRSLGQTLRYSHGSLEMQKEAVADLERRILG